MSFWERHWKFILIGLIIATVVGWIAFWSLFFYLRVWTPEFGYTAAPSRIFMEYAYGIIACLPFGLLWMHYSTKYPQWFMPPGRYREGEKVRVWNQYITTSIAIGAAAFAVAGFGEYVRVDLQALTVAFLASYFGSIPAFLGLWFGQIICRIFFVPFVWGGGLGFIDVVAWTTMDAAIWAYAGVVFFKFYHGKPEWPRWKRLLVVMLIAEPIHQLFWFFRYWIMNPFEAALAAVIMDWTTYWNISWVLVLIGYIIGGGLYELRARGRRI